MELTETLKAKINLWNKYEKIKDGIDNDIRKTLEGYERKPLRFSDKFKERQKCEVRDKKSFINEKQVIQISAKRRWALCEELLAKYNDIDELQMQLSSEILEWAEQNNLYDATYYMLDNPNLYTPQEIIAKLTRAINAPVEVGNPSKE